MAKHKKHRFKLNDDDNQCDQMVRRLLARYLGIWNNENVPNRTANLPKLGEIFEER